MPLEHRRARPTGAARKTATTAGGQRLQPHPHRVRRKARPFSGREVGDFSCSQMRRGRCVRGEDLLRGLLKTPRGLRDHAAEGRKARPQSRTRPRGRDGAGRGPESAPGRLGRRKASGPEFHA